MLIFRCLARPELLGERMGTRSWRCWRETEIWRAMDTLAAVLRRSSVSTSSTGWGDMGEPTKCLSLEEVGVDVDTDEGVGDSSGTLGKSRERFSLVDERGDVDDDCCRPIDAIAVTSTAGRRGLRLGDAAALALRNLEMKTGAWLSFDGTTGGAGCEGAVVLDVEVEAEWLDWEVAEPDTDVASVLPAAVSIICQDGS